MVDTSPTQSPPPSALPTVTVWVGGGGGTEGDVKV